jgi:hypothetical protein
MKCGITGLKFIVACGLILFCCGTVSGFSAPGNALSDKIDELLLLVEAQNARLKAQQEAIEAQERRFSEYRKEMETLLARQQESITRLESRGESAPSPTPSPAAAEAAPPRAVSQAAPLEPVGRPPEAPDESRPPEIAAIFDQPGVLTAKGALVVEPSLQFTHSTSKRLFLLGFSILPALHIGPFELRDVRNNAYTAALATRYGLTNRLELELKIPYVYRTEESSSHRYVTPDSLSVIESNGSREGYGLGDVEFGLRYQLNQPRGGPYYVAGLRIKSDTGEDLFDADEDELPTGSGFWGLQPNLTAIFASDPAVFFGGVNYLWNIERNIGGYGKIDPGDAYGFNFGMGLSLNEKAAFSMGYEHSVISRTRQNGEVMPGQVNIHVGTFQLGYSYRLSDWSSLNLSLGLGVTEDAPDVQLTLKTPLTF